MREIKFRAWDGERMLNRTLFDRNWYTHDDKCVRSAMPSDARTLKVMQYTGLKDANGVEIYEGDIVHDYSLRPRLVSFNNNNYAKMLGWNLLDSDGEPDEYYYGVSPDDTYKVIGNIYENPELMK